MEPSTQHLPVAMLNGEAKRSEFSSTELEIPTVSLDRLQHTPADLTTSTATAISEFPTKPSPSPPSVLVDFQPNQVPHAYKFDQNLSLDENYLTLVLIYTRLSASKRGAMACVIVTPPSAEIDPTTSPAPVSADFDIYSTILTHSNNTPLPFVPCAQGNVRPNARAPNPKCPEIHAEARAICLAASQGIRLAGTSLYVSFPPCSACFQLIAAAGIKRCVFRREMRVEESVGLAAREGVELVSVMSEQIDNEMKSVGNKFYSERGETKEITAQRSQIWWDQQANLIDQAISRVRGEAAAVNSSVTAEDLVTPEDEKDFVENPRPKKRKLQ